METKKIALACFIGGAICVAISLLVAPYFWWLGLLAGFGAGYLAYEFKEVFQAIPTAWQIAKKGTGETFKCLSATFKWLFGETHPLLYIPVFLGVSLTYSFVVPFDQDELINNYTTYEFFKNFSEMTVWTSLGFGVILLMISNAGYAWQLRKKGLDDDVDFPLDLIEHKEYFEAHPDLKLTYSNLTRWSAIGIVVLMYKLISGILALLALLALFVGMVLKLIHSEKRLLCGVDGALGGGVMFWMIHTQSLPLASQLLTIFFGGIFGAMFGVLNWEIISKRIFHLPLKN